MFEVFSAAVQSFVTTFKDESRHLVRENEMRALNNGAPVDLAIALDPSPSFSNSTDKVSLVLCKAEEQWKKNIHEVRQHRHPAPKSENFKMSSDFIDSCIRSKAGGGWGSCEYWEGARPNIHYLDSRKKVQWCGFSQTIILGAAGLKAEIRQKRMPSTYRLFKFARKTERWVDPGDVQAGDIVIVGPSDDVDGAHITLCSERVIRGNRFVGIRTFEGNAYGAGPEGEQMYGYITRERPLPGPWVTRSRTYRVVFGVRFLRTDYV